MSFRSFFGLAGPLVLIAVIADAARHGHSHKQKHGTHSVIEAGVSIERRNGQCQFPTNVGLVAVTPSEQNGGWAMSPNQPCLPGHYCPYACPPGQVMMQWDPAATSYTYPLSMNGGLYCDHDGNMHKPFPDKPYCQEGTGAVTVVNHCATFVSFCQTVLPGNEAMLIPTLVTGTTTLAVPGPSYWCETAAHYYVNPPGINTGEACVWGTSENPFGNWSPYVAGANTVSDGNTFVKIGWNPIYLQPGSAFSNQMPNFGLEIMCDGNNCNGLPCKIDPAVNGVNEMVGSSTDGAGGAAFCVVTVPPGESAKIVIFDGSSNSGSSSTSSAAVAATPSATSTSSSLLSSSHTSTAIASTDTPSPLFGEGSLAVANQNGSNSSVSYSDQPHVFIQTSSSMASSPTLASAQHTSSPQATKKSAASTAMVSTGLVLSAVLALMAFAL